jgi:hypothetical protein
MVRGSLIFSSRSPINSASGHLPSSQPRAQSPCQYSKGVGYTTASSHVQLLTIDRMLYEFHRQQNGKKPGTVHATYLISGTKRVEEPEITPSMKKDGEDEHMQSSPFMNSSMPQADEGSGASSVLTITLTREEDLESTYCTLCQPIQMLIASRNTVRVRANNFHSHLQPWPASIERPPTPL